MGKGRSQAIVEESSMSERLIDPEEIELIFKNSGIPNLREVAQEMKNVKIATTEAAGDEGQGTGFAGLSKGAFQAERVIAAMATGQGLARIGPMLEGIIGVMGGPMGFGFAISTMVLAAEKYIPQLIGHFDTLDTETGKHLKHVQDALKDTAVIWKKVNDDFAALKADEVTKAAEKKPEPGHAGADKEKRETIEGLFAGKAEGQTEKGVIQQLMRGAEGMDMTPEEAKEFYQAEATKDEAIRKQRLAEQLGPTVPGFGGDHQKDVDEANDRLKALEQTIFMNRAKRMIAIAMKPGPEGANARKMLAQMADQRPDLFGTNFAERLRSIDTADTRVARQAMEKFAVDVAMEEAEEVWGMPKEPPKFMQVPPGGRLGDRGPTMGQIPGAVPQMKVDARGEPIPERFGPDMQRRQGRFQGAQPFAREPARHDLDIDELGNIVMRTQEATNQALSYTRQQHNRWQKLKESTKRLEDNVRNTATQQNAGGN